jgi:putative Holliday junction resolvase
MILGIDFGPKNMGLAISSGRLAEPFRNLKVTPSIFETIRQICERLEIKKIVIGISEGKTKEETYRFTRELKKTVNIPIKYQDETLTTKLAGEKLMQTGSKKKRRRPKHAFAATLILQDYLDDRHS